MLLPKGVVAGLSVSMDTSLFTFVNTGMRCPFLDVLMPLLSNESFFRLPLAALWLGMIIWGGRKGRTVALLALLLLLLSEQLSSLLKLWIKRPRPCHALPDVHLLVGCSRSYSFPSSHASNVAAVGVFLAYSYRWLLLPAVLVLLAVGLSRVYLGVHYPSDVAGGALLGLLCAAAGVFGHRGLSSWWMRREKHRETAHA